MNPMFRFAVTQGTTCLSDTDCFRGDGCNVGVCNEKEYTGVSCAQDPCAAPAQCDCGASLASTCTRGRCFNFTGGPLPSITPRDSIFRFSTNNSFTPLLIPLTLDPTALINPQRVTYLPSTSEVVVTDGSINGIIFVSLQSSSVSRSYF